MADYRLRAYRRYPQERMRQVVVYLTRSTSELVYQDNFAIDNLRSNFEVIRLWEQPTELFLASPGLLPFAVLSQTPNPDQIICQVAQQIESIPDYQRQSNIAASAALLAGLVLNKELIHSVLRREIMRESVIYQEIKAEGVQSGVQQGIQQEAVSFVRRLLKRRVGDINPQQQTQLEALSVDQLEALGEALLDFTSEEDLVTWLQDNSGR
jgi:predicted transposase YdaD